MALAETAVLAVELKLNGVTAYTSGIAKAEAATATLGKTASSGLTTGLAKAEKGIKSLGGALGHAGSAIGGLVTGPLGLIGLTAGLFSVGGAIKEGITRAQQFGETVDRLMSVTGQSVETVSKLASAFDYFGVSGETTIRVLSMAEKNLGLLASTSAKAADFAKTYGLSLVDSSGHVKDMNTLVLDSADFFNNKLIPASTKAAALSKIFGRNWQELVEVFEKGKPAIAAAEQQAKDLGLTLSGQNLDDLLKYRDAQRELNTAMGGLELQIGLGLVPAFTDLAKSISSFVKDNRAGIVQFFKDAAANVGKFGDFIAKDVIPPLKSLGSAAKAAWDAIPGPLKQILVGGIIANKAGKFLFDISIKDAAGGLLEGLGKSIFARGGSPATPLFVTDVGGDLGKGLGGAAGLGASLSLSTIAAAIALLAIPVVLIAASKDKNVQDYAPKGQTFVPHVGFAPTPGGPPVTTIPDKETRDAVAENNNTIGAFLPSGSIKDAQQTFVASLKAAAAALVASRKQLAHDFIKGFADRFTDKEIARRSKAKFGHDPSQSAIDATRINAELHELKVITTKSPAKTETKLARLQALAESAKAHGDTVTAKKIQDAITKMKASLGTNVQATTSAVTSGTQTLAQAIAAWQATIVVNVDTTVVASDVQKKNQKKVVWGPSDPSHPVKL